MFLLNIGEFIKQKPFLIHIYTEIIRVVPDPEIPEIYKYTRIAHLIALDNLNIENRVGS